MGDSWPSVRDSCDSPLNLQSVAARRHNAFRRWNFSHKCFRHTYTTSETVIILCSSTLYRPLWFDHCFYDVFWAFWSLQFVRCTYILMTEVLNTKFLLHLSFFLFGLKTSFYRLKYWCRFILMSIKSYDAKLSWPKGLVIFLSENLWRKIWWRPPKTCKICSEALSGDFRCDRCYDITHTTFSTYSSPLGTA